jgi:hypothetical protein
MTAGGFGGVEFAAYAVRHPKAPERHTGTIRVAATPMITTLGPHDRRDGSKLPL